MAYIDLWNGEKLDPERDEILRQTTARWDKAPNIVRALALNKQVLIGEDLWSDHLMKKGLLTRKFKEAIATTVSATNKCLYCTSAHAWAMEITGSSKKLADSCTMLLFDGFEERERVGLEFTRKATADSKSITQEDIDTLTKYFSKAEIVEIAAVIMAFVGYNTFVEVLGLEVDDWMNRGLEERWV